MTDITEFKAGDTIKIDVTAKNRDGTQLTSPDTATLSFVIARLTGGTTIYKFDASPQVTVDVPTSVFTVELDRATDYPLLIDGVSYRYDVWIETAAGEEIYQEGGSFVLGAANQIGA